MNKFWPRILVVVVILLPIIWLFSITSHLWRYLPQQILLSNAINVSIKNYPPFYLFPESYFREALTSGMTKQEVHKIVIGYKKVFTCGESEIYYYFSTNSSQAYRIKIWFSNEGADKNPKFLDLFSATNKNELLPTDICVLGRYDN